MSTSRGVRDAGGRSGVTAAVLLATVVSAAGLVVFTSVVSGTGEWVEGRELATVGPWAVPALVLAAGAVLAAVRTLVTRRGLRPTLVLATLVLAALVALVLVNPSIAPPVP